ncbi:hypothetical protein PG994_007390 [Apiospora phragmitis]|uniref:BRCT domain-containing protein n=1 Tax=Apiospora phragmitis TaxID=2905665 RepID=A0ABR1V0Q9_9PEZI
MDVQSPPKRMTRARAAAKAGSGSGSGSNSAPTAKPTRAAATSKATAATTTVRTAPSTKRKTRADEENDEESHNTADELAPTSADTMNKPPRARGRPKKIVESAPQQQPEQGNDASSSTATARATRGRVKKPATGPSNPELVKATRTRTTRKAAQPEEDKADTPSEPPKKSARTRATAVTKKSGTVCTTATTNPTPGLKSAVSRPASRIVSVKKSVSFQEPEKENVMPTATTTAATKAKDKKAETATGMRAKPVRKAAGTAARATRASTRTTTSDDDKKEKPAPLSPKKDTLNRSLSRDSDSDDELATYEKTPLRKSPVKPPSTFKMIDLGFPTSEKADETEEATERQPEDASSSTVLTSPARRPTSSPFKDAMKSPAKRVDGVPSLLFPSKNASDVTQSPTKASLLQSPAKRPQVPLTRFQPPTNGESDRPNSPLKMSLMGSPAKRPASPMKLLGSPIRSALDKTQDLASTAEEGASGDEDAVVDEDHEVSEVSEAREEIHVAENDNMETALVEIDADTVKQPEAEINLDSPQQLEFPGRLSAVLPRHADPALQEKRSVAADAAPQAEQTIAADTAEIEAQPEEVPTQPEAQQDDCMDVDMDDTKEDKAHDISPESSPPRPAIKPTNPMFGLRQKDMVPYESDESEDELASSGRKFQDEATLTLSAVPATPTPGASKTPRNGLPTSAIKAADRAIRSVSRGSKLGFTPLARQLSDWRAGSPLKLGSSQSSTPTENVGEEDLSLVENNTPKSNRGSPAKSSYFEDEMRVRAEMEADESEMSFDADAEMLAALEADIGANYDDPVFDDIPVTEEDMELAAEAHEMSLVEPEQAEEVLEHQANDDEISEASQEYGDENAVPIDPALLGGATGRSRVTISGVPPVTPVRPSSMRTFNTTTKVPLKPADDATPKSAKRRSVSASRAQVARPGGLSRNATVISYSPTKHSEDDEMDLDDEDSEQPPVTPSKSDLWSAMGTPARTPRKDLNPALLRGAVCFVDVHTTEGADASAVFVDLLTSMGARCVKNWTWNPSSPNGNESSQSKIGITHVVFKDGGKRTMEKVRESGGVVQCVGVGWVLDCERENEWMDEAPYYVDTSLVPRGGQRRRKSMEPKALANRNGTLVTPMKQTSAPRDCQTVPNNHVSRRDSTAWMRTPSDRDEDEEMDAVGEEDWDAIGMLTPVPKTPAPETIARFAMDVAPETPAAQTDTEEDDSPEKDAMLMRTAPPKPSLYAELGQGLLGREKDQGVMMRLMAARRKSLQFAPKIASPLSKAWKN